MGLLCDLVILFSIYSTRDFGYIANEKTHDFTIWLKSIVDYFGEFWLGIPWSSLPDKSGNVSLMK